MNRIYLLSLLACTIINTYAAEQQAVALPDWRAAHQTLCDDYTHYLKDQLEQYKTSPVTLETLSAMAQTIKQTGPVNEIVFIRDEQQNAFIHLAIEKEDTEMVTQLYKYAGWHLCNMANGDGKTPLDLCLAKLSPDNAIISAAMCTITAQTLHEMTCMPDRTPATRRDLKKGLKSVLAWHLAYQKQQKKLPLPAYDSFYHQATRKICDGTTQDPLALLASLYRKAADEADGNTFTHFFIEQELPDELFEWIQKDRVSCAKNKAELTPIDLALAKFREFSQNYMLIEGDEDSFKKRSCCLFMLLNYIKIKTNAQDAPFTQCCDKHIVS